MNHLGGLVLMGHRSADLGGDGHPGIKEIGQVLRLGASLHSRLVRVKCANLCRV